MISSCGHEVFIGCSKFTLLSTTFHSIYFFQQSISNLFSLNPIMDRVSNLLECLQRFLSVCILLLDIDRLIGRIDIYVRL